MLLRSILIELLMRLGLIHYYAITEATANWLDKTMNVPILNFQFVIRKVSTNFLGLCI